MIARARVTIIDLDHERLAFVSGTVSAGRVEVSAAGSATRPEGLDIADAGALGDWVGQELRKAGIAGAGAGRVILCVPRGNVVMKRLAFPGLESHDDPDLVEMVRLSMTRQMPMKVDGTAIDFIPLARPGVGAAGGAPAAGESEGPALEVLACAFPGDRVAWCRDIALAAGLRLGALTLRATGAATLLSQHTEAHDAPIMGVCLGWSSVEFLVVDDGEIIFVRSVDVPLSEAAEATQYAQRVAVEAKRTWMAYRVSPGSGDVGALVVVGEGDLATEVAQRCADALELAPATCPLPPFVSMDDPAAAALVDRTSGVALAPLVGLMVATASSRPIFDFAHPRRPPDRTAGLRRAALLVVLVLIVVGGGFLAFATIRVEDARSAAVAARTRATELGSRVTDLRRADMRLKHIEQWLSADVDWLAHATYITTAMPAPPDALLDSLSGSLTRAEILFEPGGSSTARTYSGSTWGLELQASLHAVGRLATRDVGNQFRQRLVSDPAYVVESRGADTESRFDMNLLTRLPTPGSGGGVEAPGGGSGQGQGEAQR